ncbi:hypothetical protein QWY81_17830 [Polaribacter undariae]|uniref:Uncharacterized protein n=1 Tax=Polaribacter sejongensis TaxID=985043 RepID=A0AAJ1R1L9_9FLAO|nr:hypothetical protein [Polaribacter undariae]MDN3621332.1 hypothetical protein [Polaribacter undariae]UWD31874.1 hypothetical protein NQP51_17295 [Polaribacter undariae]
MSVKGHTHKELEAYLKAEIPSLKWFDKDKGQFENASNHVMPYPAILFSFGNTPYETLSNKVQKGAVTLRFRIGVESYADSFVGSINQDKALEFFDFNEKVFVALQGLSTTYLRNLERSADEDDNDHKNVIVTIMEFTGTLIDDSAEEGKNFTLVEPELNVTYKKELTRAVDLEDDTIIIPG